MNKSIAVLEYKGEENIVGIFLFYIAPFDLIESFHLPQLLIAAASYLERCSATENVSINLDPPAFIWDAMAAVG